MSVSYEVARSHQDKRDDAKLGLRSSALTLGDDRTKPALGAWTCCAVAGIGVAGYNAGFDPYDAASLPFYASLGVFSAHLGWQITSADLADPANLLHRFRSNAHVAPVLLAGISASKLLQVLPPVT